MSWRTRSSETPRASATEATLIRSTIQYYRKHKRCGRTILGLHQVLLAEVALRVVVQHGPARASGDRDSPAGRDHRGVRKGCGAFRGGARPPAAPPLSRAFAAHEPPAQPTVTVSKTVVGTAHRGFESHSLRQGRQAPTPEPRLRSARVAPSGQLVKRDRFDESYRRRVVDEFSARYGDLVSGSYDCVDRIVLNAYFALGHNPGGFRTWWRRLHGESDEDLDNAHLMRMAGRFSRRVRGGRGRRGSR